MNISEHISLSEATHSEKAKQLGLDNTPEDLFIANMKLVALMCFEKVRNWYGKPIKINSFYRSPEVNKAVNGSPTSDHMRGHAIDLTAGSREENLKLFNWMKLNLIFDQLIWENDGAWIHVSYRAKGNRNQTLNLQQTLPK